jgi:hypothetical protein
MERYIGGIELIRNLPGNLSKITASLVQGSRYPRQVSKKTVLEIRTLLYLL